jgi:hypothetical protein
MFKNLSQKFLRIGKVYKERLSLPTFRKTCFPFFKKSYFCSKNEEMTSNKISTEKKSPSQTFSDDEEDSIVQDKTVYDFFDASFNLQIESLLNKVKCQGCGIHMQTEHPSKIGYIPKHKLKEYINPSSTPETEPSFDLNDQEIKEFEKIHDRATLKKIKRLKYKKNVIICERCYKLTNYLTFEDLSKKSDKKDDETKINDYTTLVKKINSQVLVSQIMKRISKKAHIFYICVRFNKLGHCRIRINNR